MTEQTVSDERIDQIRLHYGDFEVTADLLAAIEERDAENKKLAAAIRNISMLSDEHAQDQFGMGAFDEINKEIDRVLTLIQIPWSQAIEESDMSDEDKEYWLNQE